MGVTHRLEALVPKLVPVPDLLVGEPLGWLDGHYVGGLDEGGVVDAADLFCLSVTLEDALDAAHLRARVHQLALSLRRALSIFLSSPSPSLYPLSPCVVMLVVLAGRVQWPWGWLRLTASRRSAVEQKDLLNFNAS